MKIKLVDYITNLSILKFTLIAYSVLYTLTGIFFFLKNYRFAIIILILEACIVIALLIIRSFGTKRERFRTDTYKTNKFVRILILFLLIVLVIPVILKLMPISTLIFLWIPIFLEIVLKDKSFRTFGLVKNNLRQSLIAGTVVGLLALPLIYFLLIIWLNIKPGELSIPVTSSSWTLKSSNPAIYILFIFYSSVRVSTGEEFFFRGFIQRRLELKLGAPVGILISNAIYTLPHLFVLKYWPINVSLVFIISVFIAGLFFATSYSETKNLLSPWIAHGILVFFMFAVGMF